MATTAPRVPLVRAPRARGRVGTGIGIGVVVAHLSVFVLLPLAAVTAKSLDGGLSSFWAAVTTDQARAALTLSLVLSALVTLVNVVTGTAIAWVLTRDRFRGRDIVNSLIDLPFALPTIVAGLTLLALYGPGSPLGVDIAYTRAAIALALAFVTLPFVIRAVQPLLESLDHEMEQAAASLGASRLTIFRRVVLPNLAPGIITGAGLGFAKAMGEFGSVVLISGNIPFETEAASVHIFGLIESDQPASAAAVSVVLLAFSLVILLLFSLIERRVGRHHRG